MEGQPVVVVEEQDHGKAHRRGQEAVEGVEHGVPVGHPDVEGVDLPQNLRREDEAQDRDLQGGGQLDAQPYLHPAGHIQKHDGQHAEERRLIVLHHQLAHQHHQHQKPQGGKDDEGALVLPQLPVPTL